jgi:hypothetical protein
MATAKKQTKKTTTRATRTKLNAKARTRISKAAADTKSAKRSPRSTATKGTKTNSEPMPTAKVVELQPADWKHWRERGYCRIWQAAMLSLNLEPSSENLSRLIECDSAKKDHEKKTGDRNDIQNYSEYARRKVVLVSRYRFDPELPKLSQPNETKKKTEHYVALDKIIELAARIGWQKFEQFWNEEKRAVIVAPTYTHQLDDESEESDLNDSRSRSQLVRMGGLLRLLEMYLQENPETKALTKKKLLKETDKSLNMSGLGETIEGIIKTYRSGLGTDAARNFGNQKIRKELAAAEKALKRPTK